jgi:uncharacterized membrane protein YhaH (DUF805 family)
MQPMNALKLAFQNYANFSGRATRGDYWWYVLAYFIVAIVLGIVDRVVFGSGSSSMDVSDSVSFSYNAGVLGGIWGLANIIPIISVTARRLHDTNRSGWMQLLVLIPLLGWLYLLYLYVQKGTVGDNSYGLDPLA